FATLIWRHGPLVWQTCKRVLRSGADVEDAFQATFMAMSRQAAKLRGGTLAGWLHRIARRAALKSIAEAKRRRNLEQQLRTVAQTETTKERKRDEVYAALDEELASLSEKLRVPLLLRYFENKTLEEVASIVGCSRPVLRDRLTKGETILRAKL